ncbi:hypothetical protein AgCh_005403 [Apium graveolens]
MYSLQRNGGDLARFPLNGLWRTLCGDKIVSRILQAGFFWPNMFKDAHQFILKCDRCQRVGNISKRDEMPLNVLLEVGVLNVWGIDFMGPFFSSCNNQYTLLAVNYVSKWVEVKAFPMNDAKVVLNFLYKKIFTRFRTPKVRISDEGSHFCNPYKTLLGMSLFQLVYGKGCYLPVELEHNAYWALKKLNLDLDAAGKKRMLQLNELDEFRLQAYENNKMYKEKVKRANTIARNAHAEEAGGRASFSETERARAALWGYRTEKTEARRARGGVRPKFSNPEAETEYTRLLSNPIAKERGFLPSGRMVKNNGFTVVRRMTVEYSVEAIRRVIDQPARRSGQDTWNDKTPEDFDLDLTVATLCT